MPITTDLGVPRSTARGWRGATPRVVVTLDVADLTEPELRQEILKLRRRVKKLAALLRLALALLHASGFSLSDERLPEGPAKQRILRRGSSARVPAIASGPSVRGTVTESVSGLAATAARLCARRSVVLPSHVTPPPEALRDHDDLGDGRGAVRSTTVPVVLADAGVENVNAEVDELIETGVLRRLLAFTELRFSNSMIEAWWRSLKHQWLYLHSLDSVATIRRLVRFYVHEHNHVRPHSAFRGQTPDEMYFGTGEAVPGDLRSRTAAARRARLEANRSASCTSCPSLNAA